MTHAIVPVQTPTSAREARVDRFLARVAALTPRQWGELDAIAQRLEARDPIGWWQRARREWAVMERLPVVSEVLSVIAFFENGFADLKRPFERRFDPKTCVLPPRPNVPPEMQPLMRASESLFDIMRLQPGGMRASGFTVHWAMVSLWHSDLLTPAAFARMYAPIEPVIPAASL